MKYCFFIILSLVVSSCQLHGLGPDSSSSLKDQNGALEQCFDTQCDFSHIKAEIGPFRCTGDAVCDYETGRLHKVGRTIVETADTIEQCEDKLFDHAREMQVKAPNCPNLLFASNMTFKNRSLVELKVENDARLQRVKIRESRIEAIYRLSINERNQLEALAQSYGFGSYELMHKIASEDLSKYGQKSQDNQAELKNAIARVRIHFSFLRQSIESEADHALSTVQAPKK